MRVSEMPLAVKLMTQLVVPEGGPLTVKDLVSAPEKTSGDPTSVHVPVVDTVIDIVDNGDPFVISPNHVGQMTLTTRDCPT